MLLSPACGNILNSDQFVVAEWTTESDSMWIAPLHRHFVCDEAWYVLDGQLTLMIDGEEVVANSGDMVLAPKGSLHTYRNSADTPTRYLLIMTPLTKSLIDAIHTAEDRSPDGLKQLFANYQAEFLGFPKGEPET